MMIILQLILALIFQNSGDIFYLIEMEGFGFASVLVMTFAGQVYLRFKEPDLPRPIKVGFLLSWVKTFRIIPEFYESQPKNTDLGKILKKISDLF